MKLYNIICILLIVTAAGCVSMPEPVDDRYVVDPGPGEEEVLRDLEGKIVKKNHEIDLEKKELQEAGKNLLEASGEVPIIEKRIDLLSAERDLAERKNNRGEAVSLEEKIKNHERKLELQERIVELRERQRNLKKEEVRVAESELSVLVAELNYRRAVIARKFMEKRDREMGLEPENEASFFSRLFGGGREKIDPVDYRRYLQRVKDTLKSDIREREREKVRVREAEALVRNMKNSEDEGGNDNE